LGTINGANQALAALCRAAGPSIGGILLSHSFEVGKPWIVWTGLAAFSTITFSIGWFLTNEKAAENTYIPIDREDETETGEGERQVS